MRNVDSRAAARASRDDRLARRNQRAFGRHGIRAMLVAVFLLVGSRSAHALPLLQLDIAGGSYDTYSQTVMSAGPVFTLYALLNPDSGGATYSDLMDDFYYISMAVTPQVHNTMDLGSFMFNGNRYRVTEDMIYGVPPIEEGAATSDTGDLAPHDIYPTYFQEAEFQFSSVQLTTAYNVQDSPGGISPNSTGTMLYVAFQVDLRELAYPYSIHFDMYSTHISKRTKTDEDIRFFAPFSHDAEGMGGEGSIEITVVPEPASLLMFGTALLGTAAALRRWGRTPAASASA